MNIYQKERIGNVIFYRFPTRPDLWAQAIYPPKVLEEVCSAHGINFELISFMLRGKHQELISIDSDGTIISVDKKGVEHTHHFSTITSPAGVTEVVK